MPQEAKGNIFAELEQATQEGRSLFRKPFELFMDAYTVVRTEDYALLVEETTIRKVLSDDFSNQGDKETHTLLFNIKSNFALESLLTLFTYTVSTYNNSQICCYYKVNCSHFVSSWQLTHDDIFNSPLLYFPGSCDYFMTKETYFPLIFCIIGRFGLPLMPFINFK